MSDVVDVTDRNWEEVVERSDKPTLAMFHSPSCPHCRVMMPHFEEYAAKFKGKVKFVRINIMENYFTRERYGVMATPTFKFFCGGRPVQDLVGACVSLHSREDGGGGLFARIGVREALDVHRLQHRIRLMVLRLSFLFGLFSTHFSIWCWVA